MPAIPRPRTGVDSPTDTLYVDGDELTRDASRLLRAQGLARLERGRVTLVVDLDGVGYVGMEGVGALFHLGRNARSRGGSLRVVNAAAQPLLRLRVAGLTDLASVEAGVGPPGARR
jgi:anti-anti-sigma regulatory factor